jgi:hypothetical protein
MRAWYLLASSVRDQVTIRDDITEFCAPDLPKDFPCMSLDALPHRTDVPSFCHLLHGTTKGRRVCSYSWQVEPLTAASSLTFM